MCDPNDPPLTPPDQDDDDVRQGDGDSGNHVPTPPPHP